MTAVIGAVLERSGAPTPYARSTPITVSELELDPPGPEEVLVRIAAASVCHSDLSTVDGSRPRRTPLVLGHESAGTVVSVGHRVEDVAEGDHVVLVFLPRCGTCEACVADSGRPCIPGSVANGEGRLLSGERRLHREGHPLDHHLGVSGFATHAVVHRSSVVHIDDDMPFEVAAMLGCAVLTGGGAVVNAAAPAPTDTVAVVGLGGVGMAAVMTAAALGVRRVLAVDTAPDKLALALTLGATAASTPDEAVGAGERFDIVIEAAGRARAFDTAFELTAPGGHTVTVGLPDPSERSLISPLVLTAEARRITGSYLGNAVPSRDIPFFERLWREGRLPVERLISARIPLSQINEAMDALREGRALRQVIVLDPLDPPPVAPTTAHLREESAS